MDSSTEDAVARSMDLVFEAIATLHSVGSGSKVTSADRRAADRWLNAFQYEPVAWVVADRLLQAEGASTEVRYYGAQTLVRKICSSLHELGPESRAQLRSSLTNHLLSVSFGPTILRTRLCIGMASLMLQSTEWPDPVAALSHTFFGQTGVQSALGVLQNAAAHTLEDVHKAHVAVCLWLELLSILPEELDNRQIPVDPSRRRAFAENYLAGEIPNLLGLCSALVQECAQAPAGQAAPTPEAVTRSKMALQCLSQWIHSSLLSLPQIMDLKLIEFAFNILHQEPLFDVCVAMICDFFSLVGDPDLEELTWEYHAQLLAVFYPLVLQLGPRAGQALGLPTGYRPEVPIPALLEAADPQAADGFCRIVSSFMELAIKYPKHEQFTPLAGMYFGFLLTDEPDITLRASDFWIDVVAADPATQALPLLSTCLLHFQYPADGDMGSDPWSTSRQEEFSEYRHRVAQILQSLDQEVELFDQCVGHLAGLLAATGPGAGAGLAPGPGPAATWQQVEAVLFALRVLPLSATAARGPGLVHLFQLLLLQPSDSPAGALLDHPNIRYTVQLVLSAVVPRLWGEAPSSSNEAILNRTLDYLMHSLRASAAGGTFQHPAMTPGQVLASATSSLVKLSPGPTAYFLSSMLPFVETGELDRVQFSSPMQYLEFLQATAIVVARHTDAGQIPELVRRLCAPTLRRLETAVRESPSLDQASRELVTQFDRLAVIFEELHQPLGLAAGDLHMGADMLADPAIRRAVFQLLAGVTDPAVLAAAGGLASVAELCRHLFTEGTLASAAGHPLIPALNDVWPVVEAVLQSHRAGAPPTTTTGSGSGPADPAAGTSSDVIELICRMLRSAIVSCGGGGFAPVFPRALYLLYSGFQATTHSSFLYAIKQLARVYATHHAARALLFEGFSHATHLVMGAFSGPLAFAADGSTDQRPAAAAGLLADTLVEDFFDLAGVMSRYLPDLMPQTLAQLLPAALVALRRYHNCSSAIKGVLYFVACVLSSAHGATSGSEAGIELRRLLRDPAPPGSVPAGPALARPPGHPAAPLGAEAVICMLEGVCRTFPRRTGNREVVDIMEYLLQLFGPQELVSWVATFVEGLPPGAVTGEEAAIFLGTLGSGAPSIKAPLVDFIKLVRMRTT
ncbi:hypothetical protein H696_05774 [Fonticula alba]|uniref:Importin N-terminal domain-containing protein n=1 Tax=Fonticula alba TaxID=691883 RepID=A0A058Z068_FONAL|nr:hypothetical protein H696_05774 [Fonticula alba]KCV67664.1 hypothetical protein H696_05774 [Fonticula alba]|eukprot:XP_009497848.1 hypothetical protein H696_05774 [Fonticula alba]